MIPAIAQRLLDEASALNDATITPQGFRQSGCIDTVHTMEWSDGVSSGEVVIEAADRETDAAADWAIIATVPYDGTARVMTPIHGAYRAFKHRISQPVTDGTVTSRIAGS